MNVAWVNRTVKCLGFQGRKKSFISLEGRFPYHSKKKTISKPVVSADIILPLLPHLQ